MHWITAQKSQVLFIRLSPIIPKILNPFIIANSTITWSLPTSKLRSLPCQFASGITHFLTTQIKRACVVMTTRFAEIPAMGKYATIAFVLVVVRFVVMFKCKWLTRLWVQHNDRLWRVVTFTRFSFFSYSILKSGKQISGKISSNFNTTIENWATQFIFNEGFTVAVSYLWLLNVNNYLNSSLSALTLRTADLTRPAT